MAIGNELGDFLREECRKRGLSLRGLSINSGLSAATVQQILRRNRAGVASLSKLADYLGVTRQYLWQLTGLVDRVEDFNDARLRSQFGRADKLPAPARTLVVRLIEIVLTFVED